MANKPGAVYYTHSPRTYPLLQQYPNQLRTWTEKYNPNLVNKDSVPGKQNTELALGTHRLFPAYPNQLRTWTEKYNPNLVNKDRLPTGKNFTERPPPRYWYREWSQNLVIRTAVAAPPFNQKDWPTPRDYQRVTPSWAASYNLNLIGQDELFIRHVYGAPDPQRWYQSWTQSLLQTTLGVIARPFNQKDWPLPGRARQQDRFYSLSYNLNLDAQDDIGIRHRWSIPAGHQYQEDTAYRSWTQSRFFGAVAAPFSQKDWPNPRDYQRVTPSWTAWYNLNLVGKDLIPGQRHFERVPRDYQRSPPSWAWWYNLNLIGKDILPAGKRHVDRPPPVTWYRDWSQNLQQSTLSIVFRPFNQFDWPLPQRAKPSSAPTWTWNYNLNLIEQDALYIRQVYKLPAQHFVREYRNWSQSLLQSTLSVVAPLPFNQYQWPLPIRAKSSSAPSWMWWYNLNLIGQDELFLRHDYGSADRPTWYRNWSQNLLQATLSPVLVQPFKQLDWPLPKDYRRGPPSWANWYNLNLIGQDVVPGKRHVELVPRDYQRSPPSWLWWYNLNLTGQDRLPAGEIFSDRPPPVTWYRDWSQNLQQSTLSIVFRPFNQFDWPLPRDFKRVTPSWTAFYNVNLIGQDRLPTGTIIYEIAPRDYKRSPPSWAWWYNLNLIAQDAFPAGKRHVDRPPPVTWYRDWSQSLTTSTLSVIFYPFNQFDWPLPIRAKLPSAPSWTWSYNLNLVAQDSFPSGDIVYERTPPDIRLPHDSFWAWTFNPNLFPPVIPPPRRGGVKVFPPRRYEPREIDKRRTFSRKYYAELLAAERAQNAAETRALRIANEEKRSAAMAALDASAEAIEKAAMDAAAEQELRKLTSALEAAARAKKVVTVLEHARHAEVMAAALEAHLRRVEEEDEEEAIMLLLH